MNSLPFDFRTGGSWQESRLWRGEPLYYQFLVLRDLSCQYLWGAEGRMRVEVWEDLQEGLEDCWEE